MTGTKLCLNCKGELRGNPRRKFCSSSCCNKYHRLHPRPKAGPKKAYHRWAPPMRTA